MAIDEFGREVPAASFSFPPVTDRFHGRGHLRASDRAKEAAVIGRQTSSRLPFVPRGRHSVSPSPPPHRRRHREPSLEIHEEQYSKSSRQSQHRRSRADSAEDDHAHDRTVVVGAGAADRHLRSKKKPGFKPHPSESYAEMPMLCQFVWEKDLEREEALKNTQQHIKSDIQNQTQHQNCDGQEPAQAPVISPPPAPSLFETSDAAHEAYLDYNVKYCLNYIRTFFNLHLDDPWFRQYLSPLERFRLALAEKSRANAEAMEMRKEILHSLEESNLGVIPKKDPDCSDYLGPPKCSFISGCRLAVGTKPTAAAFLTRYNNNTYAPHHTHRRGGAHRGATNDTFSENNHHDEGESSYVLQGEDRNRIERHAKCHLHSFIKSDACVKVTDVPPFCTNDQILSSVARHCNTAVTKGSTTATTIGTASPIAVWSGEVHIPTTRTEEPTLPDPYFRSVFVVFPSREAKDLLLEKLNRYNEDSKLGRMRDDRYTTDRLPRTLELDVDCTDVYGRREVDSDGMGNAPPSLDKKKPSDTKLPTKQCTVLVSTATLSTSQPVSVLSAAVSSRERIQRDKETVTTIATTLDRIRGISNGNRLSDLLLLLYPADGELATVDYEDILDVSIAYLRRVHLFSFYNGCSMASSIGSVLTHAHPVGTIHLRLRNADEILRKTAEEKGGGDVAVEQNPQEDKVERSEMVDAKHPDVNKDMLVMRLNNSIAKALELVQAMAKRGPTCLINEETDAAAKEIEESEQQTKEAWLENHGLDEDGRARCTFHFCRKLFKDKAFLQKHLLKKHIDHLRAECAKCHDNWMMAAWDNDEIRPVPPILVDCGAKFGGIPSAVLGSMRPMAHDPEPQLWKEEEERMAEEDRWRQERQAIADAAVEEAKLEQQRRLEEIAGEKRKSAFVDVDHMEEEKVELSFDNVEVAVVPKKKKKKKSLL